MWALFAGIPIGLAQFFASKKFLSVFLEKQDVNKGITVVLGVLDVVLLIAAFLIAGLIDLDLLIWLATGICGTMIITALIVFLAGLRKGKDGELHN